MLENQRSNSGEVPVIKNDEILVSQVLQFLMAGFESSATTLAIILNCLAIEEDIQDKLRVEIRESISKHVSLNKRKLPTNASI